MVPPSDYNSGGLGLRYQSIVAQVSDWSIAQIAQTRVTMTPGLKDRFCHFCDRKCYFPSEPDGNKWPETAIFRLYLVMMLSYFITPPKPLFCIRVPLRSSVVLASRL